MFFFSFVRKTLKSYAEIFWYLQLLVKQHQRHGCLADTLFVVAKIQVKRLHREPTSFNVAIFRR